MALSIFVSLCLGGCVDPDTAYTIAVFNETDDGNLVDVKLVERANGTTVFSERLSLDPQSWRELSGFPDLSMERRSYEINVTTDSGLSGSEVLHLACGSCADEVHIEPDHIWFSRSINW